jgi:hypothetical protein
LLGQLHYQCKGLQVTTLFVGNGVEHQAARPISHQVVGSVPGAMDKFSSGDRLDLTSDFCKNTSRRFRIRSLFAQLAPARKRRHVCFRLCLKPAGEVGVCCRRCQNRFPTVCRGFACLPECSSLVLRPSWRAMPANWTSIVRKTMNCEFLLSLPPSSIL